MMLQSTLVSVLLFPFGGVIQETEAQTTVQDYRICGLNYTHVIDNCRSNPTCPSGDDCPIGYTCYQLNEALCPSIQPTAEPTPVPSPAPTPLPSPAPTASYNVCAGSFIEARNACQDPTKACATCNNVTEACFTILETQCIDPTTETPTAAPIVKITQSPSMSAIPTKAPTFNKFFCATSWEVADEDCDSLTPCPNGQQDCFDPETNCFEIQAERCTKNAGSPEEEGDDSGVQLDEPATSSPGVVTTETEESEVSNVQSGEPAATIVVTETSDTSGVQVEAPSPSIPATGSSVTEPSGTSNVQVVAPSPSIPATGSTATGTSNVQVVAPSPSIPATGSSVTESSGTSNVQVVAPSPSIPATGSSVTESSGTSGVNPSTSTQTVSVPPPTPVVTFGTKAPVPSPVFNVGGPVRVCGRDAFEAATNCNFDPNRPCPNFPCGPGEICFELDSCNTVTTFTSSPTVATESPTPGPSEYGFIWTTPAPNASNKTGFSAMLKSLFAVAVGAALTLF